MENLWRSSLEEDYKYAVETSWFTSEVTTSWDKPLYSLLKVLFTAMKNRNLFYEITNCYQNLVNKGWTREICLYSSCHERGTVVNIHIEVSVFELKRCKGRCSPAVIWLWFWFSQIRFDEIFHSFYNLWHLSCRSFVYLEKNRGYKGIVSSLLAYFFLL